jgi:hypothetical protein
MNPNEVLRHFLAALAYRLQKAIRGAPEEYWAFEPGQGVHTPRQIVRHINRVLNYGLAVLGFISRTWTGKERRSGFTPPSKPSTPS